MASLRVIMVILGFSVTGLAPPAAATESPVTVDTCIPDKLMVLRVNDAGDRPLDVLVEEACKEPAPPREAPTCGLVAVELHGVRYAPAPLPCSLAAADVAEAAAKGLANLTRATANGLADQVVRHVESALADARMREFVRGLVMDMLDPQPKSEGGGLDDSGGSPESGGASCPTSAVSTAPLGGMTCGRTARTVTAGGEWSIVVEQASIAPITWNVATGGETVARLGTLSLPLEDVGQISQGVSYGGGSWWPVFPPSELPHDDVEIHERSWVKCIGGIALVSLGVAFIATSEHPLALATLAVGGALIVEGVVLVSEGCSEYVTTTHHPGVMYCEGFATVDWGGSNSYRSTLFNLAGLMTITAGSDGPGATHLESPVNHFLYAGPGYYESFPVCQSALQANRDAQWQQYWSWGPTQSGLTDASAFIEATIPLLSVDLGPGSTLPEVPSDFWWLDLDLDEYALQLGLPVDVVPGGDNAPSNQFAFRCNAEPCPTEIALRFSSCGQQILAAAEGSEDVTYKFVGSVGCSSVQVCVSNACTGLEIPAHLNGEFTGQGGGRVS